MFFLRWNHIPDASGAGAGLIAARLNTWRGLEYCIIFAEVNGRNITTHEILFQQWVVLICKGGWRAAVNNSCWCYCSLREIDRNQASGILFYNEGWGRRSSGRVCERTVFKNCSAGRMRATRREAQCMHQDGIPSKSRSSAPRLAPRLATKFYGHWPGCWGLNYVIVI